MKKLVLFIAVTILFTGVTIAQKVEMKVGETIDVKELVNKRGKKTGGIHFMQNNNRLHYVKMFKTLKELEACSENMKLAKKYRTRAIIFVTVGTLTIPLGYLIMVAPLMSSKKKEMKYVMLSIEDYNQSLE